MPNPIKTFKDQMGNLIGVFADGTRKIIQKVNQALDTPLAMSSYADNQQYRTGLFDTGQYPTYYPTTGDRGDAMGSYEFEEGQPRQAAPNRSFGIGGMEGSPDQSQLNEWNNTYDVLQYNAQPITARSIAKGIAHKVGLRAQGGYLNYSNYIPKFQRGGTAEQQQSGGIEEQVMALVQAASQGDQSAQQQIQQIMQAAQQGDSQAAQIAQMIQAVMQQMQGGSPQEMQDGGALGGGAGFGAALASAAGQGAASFLNTWAQGSREAEANRKATYDNGGKPITPQSQGLPYGQSPSYKRGGKTPCPCMLKRQGGRLIEIDSCTGKQIFRRGGSVQAYQNAAGPVVKDDDRQYTLNTDSPIQHQKTYTKDSYDFSDESNPQLWEEYESVIDDSQNHNPKQYQLDPDFERRKQEMHKKIGDSIAQTRSLGLTNQMNGYDSYNFNR